MKEKINAVVNSLIVQDYILFGSTFILFLVLMVLAILLREKRWLSRIVATIAFLIFILGPSVGYVQMHNYIFKHELSLSSEQKLEFTKAIVVHGVIKNLSKKDFSECRVTAKAYRKTPNRYKNYILRLKPIQKSSIIIKDIKKDQTKEFKMFIEPFSYTKDYEVGLGSDCR